MPERTQNPWGWTRPAARLLIFASGSLGLGLASLAESRPAEPIEVRLLAVDPNTVPGTVLEALPGIGPVRAAAIVSAREVRPFRSLADLDKRVKGIGPVTAAALKPFLRFEPIGDPPRTPRD